MIVCNAIFLQTPFDEEGTATITGDDGKHIVRVMRMDVDDNVIAVSDGEAYVSDNYRIAVGWCRDPSQRRSPSVERNACQSNDCMRSTER